MIRPDAAPEPASTEQPTTAANALAASHSSELSGFPSVDTGVLADLVHIGGVLRAAEEAPHVRQLLADGRRSGVAGYAAGAALGSLESLGAIQTAAQELQADMSAQPSPPES